MSRIEQIIAEIEEYIENCKYQPLSNSKIIVNRDEIEELVEDLRHCLPDEIKKYQRIIANRDAILQDAQDKSDQTIKKANELAAELVSEHEIMQHAYKEANRVINEANGQAAKIVADATEQGKQVVSDYNVRAEDILNKANTDANEIRRSAAKYTDDSLGMIEDLLSSSIESLAVKYDAVLKSLQANLDVAIQNRNQVHPVHEVKIQPSPEPIAMVSENTDPASAPQREEYRPYDTSDLGYDRNSTLEEAYAAAAAAYPNMDTEEITDYDF